MTRKEKVAHIHAYDGIQHYLTGAHFGSLSYVEERDRQPADKKRK